jgi:hypothetical protein
LRRALLEPAAEVAAVVQRISPRRRVTPAALDDAVAFLVSLRNETQTRATTKKNRATSFFTKTFFKPRR